MISIIVAEKFNGSCLCGAIRYCIEGDADRFYHCHCSRCRKATGTGHASNLLMARPVSVEWLTGEKNLRSYKVADAKRFATVFCGTCGSPLPRVAPDNSMAVIPAGSLDSLPSVSPQARIFYDSRMPWTCCGQELPTYSRYPD
ncbi:MAG: GFA family protein [Gammaproteobacteria bacterium]|nr:GFA family protein [Gammaproteobacteria bacterium]